MQRARMAAVLTTGLALTVFAFGSLPVQAAEKTITVHAISAEGVGAEIGTIAAKDTPQGLMLTPNLKGLAPPGVHGFHVHEKPDCGPGRNPQGQMAAGMAAGGHYDPHKTGKHHGPHDKAGHLGDLPPLVVNDDGAATLPVIAPRLKVSHLSGRAVMIHAGGDNYSDQPAALGGGGGRIACGVVK